MFCLEQFINKYVTKRERSLFLDDIESNKAKLEQEISGKTVLVIGGAGSIGSSYVRAILPFHPASLVVVDTNENALADLTRDLRCTKDLFIPEDFVTYPMSFSSDVFKKMFRSRGGFDIVANFSAHKHVRSEKDIYSIEALVQNNIIQAKGLLDLLTEIPPKTYFCVSTDKAANPVNIMGASKRIMEDVIFSYSDKIPVKTARFANVAFSNGSLPDSFIKRIAKLQPLSGPSNVKRYFVSPEESGQICLLASILGNNREIFFPKLHEAQMGTFDKIADDLLREHGFTLYNCKSENEAIDLAERLKSGAKEYPVYFTPADTSGEKTYEEFFTDDEVTDMERYASLGVILDKEIVDSAKIEAFYDKLVAVFENEDAEKQDVVDVMKEYLPNFEHIETGRSLDSKM